MLGGDAEWVREPAGRATRYRLLVQGNPTPWFVEHDPAGPGAGHGRPYASCRDAADHASPARDLGWWPSLAQAKAAARRFAAQAAPGLGGSWPVRKDSL